MLDTSGFADLRKFLKRDISYARYRVGSTWYTTTLNDVKILSTGKVRAQLTINSNGSAITVKRVELYNHDQELLAHQDCSIAVSANQTGILFWFDFTITEEAS